MAPRLAALEASAPPLDASVGASPRSPPLDAVKEKTSKRTAHERTEDKESGPVKHTALQTPQRARWMRWYLHMALIHMSEFSAEAARGLVLPTLFTYAQELGGDLVYVGLLTSVFSVGRFFSSLLFGWMSDRVSFRTLYNLSGCCAIVGNLLFILPYSSSIRSRALLAFSRFVVGFGAGNRSVCRANIAMLTRVEQRLQYFTMFATVVFLAYALTPALGGVVGDAEAQLDSGGYVIFNRMTAPGFLLVMLNSITVGFNNLVFDETISRDDAPIERALDTKDERSDGSCTTTGTTRREKVGSPATPMQNEDATPLISDRMAMAGMLVFIFLNFNARGVLSIFETVNVPLFLEVTGRKSVESEESVEATSATSTFYLVVGLLGLVTYVTIHCSRKRFSDVTFVIFGFAMLLVGNTILLLLCALGGSGDGTAASTAFDVFVLAEVFVWSIGCPVTSAVIVSAFSKVLGTRRQGFLMGIFGSSASVARVILPLLPGLLPNWASLFAVNLVLCAICIGVLVGYLVRIDKIKRAESYSKVALETPSSEQQEEIV